MMETQLPVTSNPKAMSIARGAGWLLDGFGYFSKDPVTWIGLMVLFFVIIFVAMFIPIIGSLAINLLMPVFMAGLILGCQAQAQGGELTVNHLFAGFSKNTGQLILLGVIYLVGVIILSVIAFVLMIMMMGGMAGLMENMQSQDPEYILQHLRIFMLVILVCAALYVPFLMAFWFAPVLVVLDDVQPLTAMKLSFSGCLVNILPFTLYGIVGLILMILAAIPLFLGLLILMPMIIASIYISYREIYHSD